MPNPSHRGSDEFPSTRWTLIFTARDPAGTSNAAEALDQICRAYWRPALAFIHRLGHPPAEAEDLVQDFFFSLTRGKLLDAASPVRGRFRSLLLKSLQNFCKDAHTARHRQKRGGEYTFISWDTANINLSQTASPDAVFDVEWAITIAELATKRLREECESKGQRWLFEALVPYLDADRGTVSYRDLSAQLHIPEKAVKHLLHELRKRYRGLLREEVAHTVGEAAEINDEIRYLCTALASSVSSR